MTEIRSVRSIITSHIDNGEHNSGSESPALDCTSDTKMESLNDTLLIKMISNPMAPIARDFQGLLDDPLAKS